ncbi:recombinase family protein [Nocardia aurea]|uniref:recombinase family protein n=1 Tax=Nocardia aurea TaxID=2144174 RepID=UPI0033A9D46E
MAGRAAFPGVPMIRCGVYLRQSDDADEDELAVGRQWNEVVEKICKPRGWEPVRYCDNDKTALGKKRKLPDRDRMLEDIEAGELQAMATWDCDRLYREPIDLEHIIDVFEANHILLATVTGDIDLSTDNGRLFARVKGAFAKAESERRSARQKSKGKQLADDGEMWVSRRPLGYEMDGTVVPHEAEAIAEAFDLYLAGHHSLMGIGRRWNELGMTTSVGNRWTHHNQIRKILENPRYAGKRAYNGVVVGDAKWEAIIEPDVWQAVNDTLAGNTRKVGPPTGRKRLLVGIALCGSCAAKEVVTTMQVAPSGRSLRLVYRCRTCFGVTKPMERADSVVMDVIVERLSRPDAEDLLVNQNSPNLAALRTEAATLRTKLETIATKWSNDELTDEQLSIMTRNTKSRLESVTVQMEDANKARLFRGITGADANKFREVGLERKRAVIDALLRITFVKSSRVGVYDPKTILCDWK